MLYLLDASIYVFRGWFALPDSLTTPEGEPVNALRGLAGTVADTLPVVGGNTLVVCFDESLTTSFRNDIDPAYKANRELPPPELERQFIWARELCEALGLPCLSSPVYEADDLMASCARLARRASRPVTLMSRDKDLAQLMRDGDRFWEGPGGRHEDLAAMQSRLGFPPARMADYLALVGDTVDNIPGVGGIGARTAAGLMNRFDCLEALYSGLENIAELGLRGPARIRRLLEAGRDAAFHARALTRLRDDTPLPFSELPAGPGTIDRNALAELDERVGLGRRNREKLDRHAGT